MRTISKRVRQFLNKSNNELLVAAGEGDQATVQELLQSGASPHCVDDDLNTPLHLACANGHLDVVDTLLEHKLDSDTTSLLLVTNLKQETVLHVSAKHNQVEVIHKLLSHCENTAIPSDDDESPNFDTSGDGCSEFHSSDGDTDVTMPLTMYRLLDQKDESGFTATTLAVQRGHLQAYLLLKLNRKSRTQEQLQNQLDLALYHGYTDIIKLELATILQIDSSSFNTDDLMKYMLVAAKGGHIRTVYYILSIGEMYQHVTADDYFRDLILKFSLSNDILKLLRMCKQIPLLEKKPTQKERHIHIQQILKYASESGLNIFLFALDYYSDSEEMTNELIKAYLKLKNNDVLKISSNLYDTYSNVLESLKVTERTKFRKRLQYSLFHAAHKGDLLGIVRLLELGVDINKTAPIDDDDIDYDSKKEAQNSKQISALQVATQGAHPATVALLLSNGAIDTNYAAFKGAAELQSTTICKLFSHHKKDMKDMPMLQKQFVMAASQGSMIDVGKLLMAGVNIDKRCQMVFSGADEKPGCIKVNALQAATRMGHANIVTFLLCNKAKDSKHKAFLTAAQSGHGKLIKLFLDHYKYDTATKLHFLFIAAKQNYINLAKILIDSEQINPNAAHLGQHSGQTPLSYAIAHNQPEMVKLLLQAGAKCNAAVIDIAGLAQNKISPLMLAAKLGNVKIVKLLLAASEQDNNYSKKEIIDALTIGVDKARVEVVKAMLEFISQLKQNKFDHAIYDDLLTHTECLIENLNLWSDSDDDSVGISIHASSEKLIATRKSHLLAIRDLITTELQASKQQVINADEKQAQQERVSVSAKSHHHQQLGSSHHDEKNNLQLVATEKTRQIKGSNSKSGNVEMTISRLNSASLFSQSSASAMLASEIELVSSGDVNQVTI